MNIHWNMIGPALRWLWESLLTWAMTSEQSFTYCSRPFLICRLRLFSSLNGLLPAFSPLHAAKLELHVWPAWEGATGTHIPPHPLPLPPLPPLGRGAERAGQCAQTSYLSISQVIRIHPFISPSFCFTGQIFSSCTPTCSLIPRSCREWAKVACDAGTRLVHTTIDPMMGNIRVIGSETQNVKNNN